MKPFHKKFIEGNRISPPDACLQALFQNFGNAINVEWYKKNGFFEAVFYKDNLEHLALFSLSGGLLEYKLNLSPEYLPEAIRKNMESKGEIMNSVMRNKGNGIEYELIVRDKELTRYLMTLTDAGNILEERKL